MKISIVTVCYNAAKTIGHCIESVCSQDYPYIEHIIIDGVSTDETVAIVEGFQSKIAQFISGPDGGIYNAMNKGIKLATGEVIGFLNSDDYLAHGAVISNIIHTMQTHNAEAVYGDLDYVDSHDIQKVIRCWKPGRYCEGAFRKGWVPPHPTFYCRQEVYNRLGGYHEEFKVAADFELMLRFIEKHKIKVCYLPEVVVKMRTGGVANHVKGILQGNKEILKSFDMNGISVSPIFFVHKLIAKLSQLLIARSVQQS